MEKTTLKVRYLGRKDHEIDQWTGTAIHWPYPFAVVDMPEENALALVKMLPSEFELAGHEPEAIQDEPEAKPVGDLFDKPKKVKT